LAIIAERPFRSSGCWLFALLASLLIIALQAAQYRVMHSLQFDRAALQAGEWYRLLTAHWVHLDWPHAWMNVAGLWLLVMLDSNDRSPMRGLRAYVLRSIVLAVAVGLALYVRHPELGWYVGLSGVLHGLIAIVLLNALWRQRDTLALFVLALLIGKLIWEHYHGALTQGMLATPVIVSAHSYGALAGLVYAIAGRWIEWLSGRLPDKKPGRSPRE
jgi:rhomboid family GlyGly-CTERM serine protease